MNLIEKLKEGFKNMFKKNKKVEIKEEVVEQPKEIVNEYRVSNDTFEYKYAEGKLISLTIQKPYELEGNNNLYKCELFYTRDNRKGILNTLINKDLRFFDEVIIGLDREKMNNDSKYAGYVLSTLLERSRIVRLHDIEFGIINDIKEPKCGNYVGSIVESDGNLSIFVDDKIGSIIENSEEAKALREKYKNSIEEAKAKEIKDKEDKIVKEQTKVDTMYYDASKREERIQELKAELEGLQTTTEQAIENYKSK